MIYALSWLVFAGLAAYYASTKNRSALLYFIASCVLSPLLVFILLLIIGENGQKCPACAEMIKVEALKCKHCGHELKKPNATKPPDDGIVY